MIAGIVIKIVEKLFDAAMQERRPSELDLGSCVEVGSWAEDQCTATDLANLAERGCFDQMVQDCVAYRDQLEADPMRFGYEVLHDEELLTQSTPVRLDTWGPFATTTICGTGEVALVLDVAAVIETVGVDEPVRRERTGAPELASTRRRGPVRVLAARIGRSTVTIPTALVDEVSTGDPRTAGRRTGGNVVEDEHGPISLLSLPDLAPDTRRGPLPIIVHERAGIRFGIAVDELLGEHHLPDVAGAGTAAIGIASAPILGDRATDAIELGSLIRQLTGSTLAEHG